MKLNLINQSRAGRTLLALVGGVGLWAGAVSPAGAQFLSPVGTWDFVESGSRDGLAYITFSSDFSFFGYEVLTTTRIHGGSGISESRGLTGDDTRNGPTTPPVSAGGTNVFGFLPITGTWGYDVKGRVIGFFPEAFDGSCSTNTVISSVTETNGGVITTTFSTNTVVDCSGRTNGVNFVGKVTPNKRFTLASTTAGGKVTFRGVPFVTLTDISGPWYGNKISSGQASTEFFSLSPSDLLPNMYFVDGSGAGYSYSGNAILSSQKKLAIVSSAGETNLVLRSVLGPFNPKKQTAHLKGLEQGDGVVTNIISFNIFKSPTTP